MKALFDTLLVMILGLNLFALGSGRIVSVVRLVALQGLLLGILPLLMEAHISAAAITASLVAVLLKGVVIPVMMLRAMRDVDIRREMEPLIGFLPSMLLGAVGTALALLLSSSLPLAPQHSATLLVPSALATIFTGFILLTARLKAISQVMGYLVLENGIYIFGLLLVGSIPLVVELGMLLDLFVAIFIVCIIVNHIQQAFSTLDTRHLAALKD